jgi:hypothetical protein
MPAGGCDDREPLRPRVAVAVAAAAGATRIGNVLSALPRPRTPLVALVRAAARFERGKLVERPTQPTAPIAAAAA